MSLETLLEAARYVEQQEEKKRARAAAAAAAANAAAMAAVVFVEHSNHVAPLNNHHNSSEPRGNKLKRERPEQDDLFCEEKMLIIDEEEPLESNNRANGNHVYHHSHQPHHHHHHQQQQQQQPQAQQPQQQQPQQQHHHPQQQPQQQQQHATSLAGVRLSPATIAGSPPATAGLASLGPQQHNPKDIDGLTSAQHNHYIDSHHNSNSNHSQNSTSSAGGSLVVDVVSDGKKLRNGPCMIRSGTREVHNKLEKNRRAHLKECFEMLKKCLPSQDDKKSSNLSILDAAIKHVMMIRRKERELDHETTRVTSEKIALNDKLRALKRELGAQSKWESIDFDKLFPTDLEEQRNTVMRNSLESMEVESSSGGLARSGARYSSTSSLSSAATASSPQTIQPSSCSTTSNVGSQSANNAATATVVSQTQGLNLSGGSQNSRDSSPPASSSPSAALDTKHALSPTLAQQQQRSSPAQHQVQQPVVQPTQQQQVPATQLHLPISAQMLNASPGLATIMPTLQHLGPGLRVIPAQDARQLIAVQSNGAVAAAAGGTPGTEARPVALVVHSTAASADNRVTFVHSTSGDRPPLALAVQSSGTDVRPVTFVSGNEARPIVLATTHAPAISVTNAQTRIRTADAMQTTHKMVGGVTLVSGTGSELARLPGGAELNILPANGVFRSVKAQPLTVQGGLTLSHAGVSIQTSKPTVTTQTTTLVQTTSSNGSAAPPSSGQPQQQHEGLPANCHLVAPSGHQPLAGLTPIVAPMTVVSQGGGSQVILASSLAGKMISTPLLKSVGQGHLPLVNAAQYLNSLVKPVVVVSSNHQQTATTQLQTQQQAPNVVTTSNGSSNGTASTQSAV